MLYLIKIMTYTDFKKTCETIPRTHNIGECTNQEETILLNTFFRLHHPDWYEKTKGEEVLRYEVRDSGAYHTKCLYLVTACYTTDIGFRGCLKNIPSSESYMDFNIKAACRFAIDRAIISPLRKEYEKRIASGEVITSAISSNQITNIRDLHIDHYDKTFNDLVVDFINQEGRVFLYSKINMGEQNSPYTRFVDSEIDARFVSYHNTNTHLRAITKKENLSI